MLFPGLLHAQTIQGVVSDEKGESLLGASVSVKNSSKGVITDFDGNYVIDVSKGETLVFSYVGFISKEIKIFNQTKLDVVLSEDSKSLDELVVTAIGIKQQKKKLGYTTQQINREALSESQTMNVASALAGQIAGLAVTNPTGIFQAPEFSLRGKKPLIVLDGIPVETDFFDMPGDDIESMNVLKGPTASALYGARGKDGAILITSKTAKKRGLVVTVNTSNMFTAGFTVFPETQKEYGSGSNGKYEFWDGKDGGISDGDMIWGPKLNTGAKIAQWNSPIRNIKTGELTDWWGDVAGTKYDDKSLYERVPIAWNSHNNLKDFLGVGLVTNNSFSVAYKDEKSHYYLSGKYAYQLGQVPNTSLSRGGLNFNSSFDISPKVTLGASLSYDKVNSPNYPRYGYGPKNHIYSIVLWTGSDVNGKDQREHLYVPGQEGYRQANYNYAWYNNPYFATYELQQGKDMDIMDAKLRLNWQILPDLSLQGRMAMHQINANEQLKSPKSYMNYGDSRNGDFKNENKTQRNVDADLLLSYFKALSSRINLSANLGTAIFHKTWGDAFQSTDGLIVPRLYSMSNTYGPPIARKEIHKKETRSIYGTANIDFYNAVFLNMTARNDWSSTLPASNNSYFYPSFSLSTLVSEYVKLPESVDYLKLYGSWAQVSSDLDPYSIYATYNKGVSYGSLPSMSFPRQLLNAEIKPEQSVSHEFGLSTAFLKNRLSLDLSYYQIRDDNQIIDFNISEASGFKSKKVNGNVYVTKGFEVVLAAKPIVSPNFKWDITANWSRSVKRITEIYGDQNKYDNRKVGDRADAFYQTVWQKSGDGKLILDAISGLPLRDPYLKNLGHLNPSWSLGLQNKFKIKDFKIEMDIDGSFGGLIRSVTTEKMWWGGQHPKSVEFRDKEYSTGKPAYVADGVVVSSGELTRDVEGNVISDTRTYAPNTTAVSWQTWAQMYPYQARVLDTDDRKFANTFDRSYFKLRRLSVAYDLTKLFDLGKLENLELSLYGYNLFMWKNIPYVDPDYGNDDNLQDPSARYIGFSLKLQL